MLKRRFPAGSKTTFYKRTCVEEFAQYVSDDGLVTKITRYEDFGCIIVRCIEEIYENRGDKLFRRTNDIENKVITDYFHPGREDNVISKFTNCNKF